MSENGGVGKGRTAAMQAVYQLAALGMTLAIAIGGGIATGFIMRLPIWDSPPTNTLFEDDIFWEVPDFHPFTVDGNSGAHREHAGPSSKDEKIPLTSVETTKA